MRTQATFITLVFCLAATGEAGDIAGTVVTGARDNRNVVVYLDRIPGKTFHPPTEPAVLDQINLTFEPHVLPILSGTKVRFPNSDNILHNVFATKPVDGKRLNFGSYPSGTYKETVFNTPGPVTLLCNVHIEMSAYIFVAETPYFAITDAQGNYIIKDVPPGAYTVRTWHEHRRSKAQTRSNVTVRDSGPTTVDFDLR